MILNPNPDLTLGCIMSGLQPSFFDRDLFKLVDGVGLISVFLIVHKNITLEFAQSPDLLQFVLKMKEYEIRSSLQDLFFYFSLPRVALRSTLG